MSWTFRKTHNLGPLRLTFTPAGMSVSLGAGPIRYTRSADGKTWRTLRIPGTGIYNRERRS